MKGIRETGEPRLMHRECTVFLRICVNSMCFILKKYLTCISLCLRFLSMTLYYKKKKKNQKMNSLINCLPYYNLTYENCFICKFIHLSCIEISKYVWHVKRWEEEGTRLIFCYFMLWSKACLIVAFLSGIVLVCFVSSDLFRVLTILTAC